ncbi:MAG: PQQ-dependent sugar dehydrogenase [Anaerolineales bacterium]|nr:PQQ-dependent sugar dehydrogenase [Anaerolineales bacterium]
MRPSRSRTGALALALGLLLAACGTATPAPIPATMTSVPATDVLVPEAAASEVPAVVTTAGATTTPQIYLAAFPDPGGYAWEPVVSGLEQPVDIQNAGDGSGRLFVVERTGHIHIIRDNVLVSDPFLDLRDRITNDGLEQGLLGLAFDPDYALSGFFYVNYTDRRGNTVVARFQVLADDPDRADPYSETRLLSIEQPYANHNGGGLAFGPDGYLYIGLGDGGSAGDPFGNGQDPNSLLGKLLRIDVDTPGTGPEIWAVGLRNPWRFSFDPATGDLYIADVGQSNWEEINFIPAGGPGGLNFGWNYWEGQHVYNPAPGGVDFVFPVAEYAHAGGNGLPGGCSVTGGVVYRGAQLPEWGGVYFFGDYCSGWVLGLARADARTWQVQPLFATGVTVTSFGADETGELYLSDFGSGRLLHLVQR